jgi:uncharacterized OB-fold protein
MRSSMTRTPIADRLFTWPSDEPQLIGSRCGDCGVVTFPAQSSCPKCTLQSVTDVLLPRRGTLWTFTTQEFLPKNPPYAGTESAEDFTPYGVGYVELPDHVMVEARLTESSADRLRIGMEMELVIEPFLVNDSGDEVMTFAFRPV